MMRSCLRSLYLLTIVLAACSSAGTKSDGQQVPEASAAVATGNGDLPDEQRQYFDDGKVTLSEYQEAFSAFIQCAVDAGIGADVKEQGRDPATGIISYSTKTLLLPPGQEGDTELNSCYQRRFAYVEIAFQTSDPGVLAAEPQEQLEFFNENYRPCLESIGVEVPTDLEFDDENWAQLSQEAAAAFQDGRCGTDEGGG